MDARDLAELIKARIVAYDATNKAQAEAAAEKERERIRQEEQARAQAATQPTTIVAPAPIPAPKAPVEPAPWQRTTPEYVSILKSEYEQLLEDSELLNALRNAGVDNWDGWDIAIEALQQEITETL